MNCPACGYAHALASGPLYPIGPKINKHRPSGYAFVCPICQAAFSVTEAGLTRALWQQAKPEPEKAKRGTAAGSALDGLKVDAPRVR